MTNEQIDAEWLKHWRGWVSEYDWSPMRDAFEEAMDEIERLEHLLWQVPRDLVPEIDAWQIGQSRETPDEPEKQP